MAVWESDRIPISTVHDARVIKTYMRENDVGASCSWQSAIWEEARKYPGLSSLLDTSTSLPPLNEIPNGFEGQPVTSSLYPKS